MHCLLTSASVAPILKIKLNRNQAELQPKLLMTLWSAFKRSEMSREAMSKKMNRYVSYRKIAPVIIWIRVPVLKSKQATLRKTLNRCHSFFNNKTVPPGNFHRLTLKTFDKCPLFGKAFPNELKNMKTAKKLSWNIFSSGFFQSFINSQVLIEFSLTVALDVHICCFLVCPQNFNLRSATGLSRCQRWGFGKQLFPEDLRDERATSS